MGSPLLGLVGLFVLRTVSSRPGGVEWHLGGVDSSSRLMICSRGDGRLILGLYSPDVPSLWGRTRGGEGSINALLNDDERYFAADALSWGIAGPYWMYALVLCIVPAWWWMLWRHRREVNQRREGGLCRACGYDIRASNERCPECGEALPPLALRRSVPDAARQP